MSKTHFAQAPWWPLKRCLWATLALLLAPLAAHGAANLTSVTATPQKLDFGSFSVLPSCSNCSITIGTDGSRTATVGVVLTNTNTGKPGVFSVACNNGSCPWTPTVSGSTTIVAGGVTMTVNTFTKLKGSVNTPTTLTVGAKLTIPNASAARGTFSSGNYPVSTSP